MKTRLLVAALLAALAAVAVLAFAAFGGAASRAVPNGSHGSRTTPPFEVRKSKFALVAAVRSTGLGYRFNKGFGPLGHPTTGIYCLPALKPSKYNPYKAPAALSLSWPDSAGNVQFAFLTNGEAQCAELDYAVRTYNGAGNLTDTTGFVIAVP